MVSSTVAWCQGWSGRDGSGAKGGTLPMQLCCQELMDEKAEEGWGYYVVYDLDTGVRRRIPGIENDGWAWGVTKTHAAISGGPSGVSNPLYLVDLEKAGVVKDGHVVPEAGDGGNVRD